MSPDKPEPDQPVPEEPDPSDSQPKPADFKGSKPGGSDPGSNLDPSGGLDSVKDEDPSEEEADGPKTDLKASDATLLRRIQTGGQGPSEQDAATELYLRYARRLHGLATRQTSEDLKQKVDPEEIVQSVFRTFFRRAADGAYDIPQGEELWRLLLVMTLNKIRRASEYHRAKRRDYRRTMSVGDDKIFQHLEQSSFEDESALQLLRLVVEDLISQLPEPQSEMVRLRIEGYEVDEIATFTRRSKRTVERTLQRFRDRMTRALEDGERDEDNQSSEPGPAADARESGGSESPDGPQQPDEPDRTGPAGGTA
ncbi:MAG: sigma-70 family RNA polymerase sigma factor [Planctomycetota bacterium]|nr:sigma-70 family RNA polymerase sigma factor [Planctomycetota bacterium]